MQWIHSLLGFISNTKIVGVIPLDIVMHLLVSYLLMAVLIVKKVPFRFAYLSVFILAIAKEIFDSFSLTNELEENLKDLVISMILPTILLMVWKIKGQRI